MALKVSRADVWQATVKDRPGAAAAKLAALAEAGVSLEFVLARREAAKPGTGVLFATPIKGAAQTRAAKKAGFKKSKKLQCVRVEGADKPGQGAKMTAALAAAGINLRGLAAMAIGQRFVAQIALDKAADATKAVRILKKL